MQRNRNMLPIHMKDNQAIDNIFEGSHMLDLEDFYKYVQRTKRKTFLK